jgi:acetyl-CoA carboxylase biotin carboxyl carrier protein
MTQDLAGQGRPPVRKPAGGTARAGRGATSSRRNGARLEARVVRDHAAIAGLAGDLLPALIAKLSASGLGEIEVREGAWKARLRKPARPGGRAGGESYAGHAPAAPAAATVTSPAERPAPEERRPRQEEPEAEELPILATSPAVGVFYPRKDLVLGMQVRAGERIGAVDVLGVREEVVAPVDGIVGTSLVESGEPVEFGQGLVHIELPEKARGLAANGVDREAAAVLGEA